jgi:hypothetical protein
MLEDFIPSNHLSAFAVFFSCHDNANVSAIGMKPGPYVCGLILRFTVGVYTSCVPRRYLLGASSIQRRLGE